MLSRTERRPDAGLYLSPGGVLSSFGLTLVY